MEEPSFEKHSLEKRPQQGAPGPAPAPAPPALRASDADRDRFADILRNAMAEGRITAEEHSERIGEVYRAKTLGELEPLVSDLPQAGRAEPAAPARPYEASVYSPGAAPAENLVAVFGGATRKGRWRVSRRTNAFALFGGIEIDLTEAVFEQQEIVINATAVFGGIEIRVPENVTLRSTGTGIFGGFDVKTVEAPDPDAPVVSLTGFAVFGGVDAKPKRGKRLKNLRAGG
ncbi:MULTISPECIES: DUF1707 SHOCT-like domain-containing protein [Streptomyces]|uniref:DUF1707 domain-containing protein n=1 Tax=Streptomyces nondiastaticus TaxID=3154512 RepID=A0ABW6U6R1_9ACTN|nr:DUF1707 domain-containing protein [Streptomyces sp. VNUA116]WKU46789.1 DUF1707 domain-containing protein [Streptomyces sp. VNUA116]